MKRQTATEFQIHCAIAALLRAAGRPDMIWFHPANGERRDAITGARLKRMGLKRGVPDFVFIVPGDVDNMWRPVPCFLEIKTPGGRQSPDQRNFEVACEAVGARYAIARSATDAYAILQSWNALRATQGERRAA